MFLCNSLLNSIIPLNLSFDIDFNYFIYLYFLLLKE
jgi:hypothetical protein